MADGVGRDRLPDPRWPWWLGNPFHFSPPSEVYDRQRWCIAVLQHEMVRDFVLLLRARVGHVLSQAAFHERLDDQARWFPLEPTLSALGIVAPGDDLWPLPQPRSLDHQEPNSWVVSRGPQAGGERPVSTVWIPLGLVLSRLTPLSPRPMVQLLAIWLAYRVLPVCDRSGGPATWAELDQMLNPVPPPA